MTNTSKICPACGQAYGAEDLFCPRDRTPLRSPDQADDVVGSLIGERFVITGPLGAGGMGEVFRAQDVRLQRTAAVKVLRAQFAGDLDALARFNREASNAVRINHAHVVQVYDYGETGNGRPYLAMEFVPGPSLRAILDREGRLESGRAAELIRQIAAGLEAAHRFDIVHRDLKPDNVLICTGADGEEQAKVVDFGISKVLGDDAQQVTRAGYVTGTREFMSPEQVRGKPLDRRSDVYALGLVGYLMLTGALPFAGETPDQVMFQRLAERPRRLRDAAPAIACSEELQAVFDRVLARDPSDRYPSAKAFATALTAALQRNTVVSSEGRSRRWLAGALAAAGVAGISLLGIRLLGDSGGDLAVQDRVPAEVAVSLDTSPAVTMTPPTAGDTVQDSAASPGTVSAIIVDTATGSDSVVPLTVAPRPPKTSNGEAARRALARYSTMLHPDLPGDSAAPMLDSLRRLLPRLGTRRDSVEADILRAEVYGRLEDYRRACVILEGAREGASERQREKIRLWVDRELCTFPDWSAT